MPEYTPQPIRIPGCIPRELAQAMEPVRQLFERAIFGDTINITVSNATNVTGPVNAAQLFGIMPLLVFYSSNIYVEGTLGGDLSSGGTATVGGFTINGKSIRSGYKIPGGSAIGAIWNGTDYTLLWANACEVVV